MTDRRYDRRTVLKSALAGLAALPAAGLVEAADATPHLDEKEQLAVSLGYVHDANKVDATKVPQYKKGAFCHNCIQLQGKEGDEWRPCNLFPGKLVAANGWCKVWAPKPGVKLG
jgi:High potential iron-sulfur protein